MKRLSIITLCMALFSGLYAQTSNLYENADAIVNNFSAIYTQTDLNNATYKETKTITILNKSGEKYGDFSTYGNKFRELQDFSGVIKNVSGAIVKKIGKKDLIISSISQDFNNDDYSIFYYSKHPTYPYTVEYTYQIKIKNGIIRYPSFDPVDGYRIAVDDANYTLELPEDVGVRYSSNYDCDVKEEKINNKQILKFSLKNLNAIDNEPMSPSAMKIFPFVYISPSNFCYDSSCGNMSDWNELGQWLSDLLKERDILPIALVDKLRELTKDAKSDREKVEILYKYLQDNTRYVSIQLGIGGYQPIDASTTWRNKFGDCKGLTNLLKAMLKAIDIESNYSVIKMSRVDREFLHDYSSIDQANHVILLVPLKNDSIWLECTSSTQPFGYVHDGIAGHDALVITENGGKLCKLPSYTSKQNKSETKLLINISEDGTAKGNATFVEHLVGYDYAKDEVTSNDREKMVEYIMSNINMPKIQIGQINAFENKTSLPYCSLDFNYDAIDLASKTGTRLFVPVCPLKKSNFNIFSSAKRNFDIEINNGFSESDTIIINIPDTYAPESLPKDILIETEFGTFSAHCVLDGSQIVYTQSTDIFTGKYSKEKYKEIKGFFSEIASAIKRKIVLKKS